MIGAAASLLVILAASLIVGAAVAAFAEAGTRSRPLPLPWLAPAYGIGTVLVLCGIAVRLPGHATTAAVVVVIATVGAAVFVRGRLTGLRDFVAHGLPVALVAAAGAALPFLLAGHVGILGAGLFNDDMASHLIIADYVGDPRGPVPSFVRGGYPIGPHGLVAAVSAGAGTGLVEAFAGLTLALPALLGLLALAALTDVPPLRRTLAACLVALPYLGAGYLSQGAFKEPLQALLLLAFALALARLVGMGSRPPNTIRAGPPAPHPLLRVLPLGILAAASTFNYSLPGLLLIGAVGGAVLLARLPLVRPRPRMPEGWARRLAPYALGVLALVAVATAGEWSRIADFSRLDALNPDRFGSAMGNLQGSLFPLEALGVWPASELDASPTSATLPAAAFYLGAALALAALLAGLLRARRDGPGLALVATLAAVAAVWVLAALFASPYIAAKALAIAAPAAMAVALRGTLSARGPLLLLGVALLLAGGLSSFLVLRGAAVAPDAHASQLAAIRDRVKGEDVLFLGRDDFIGWELRGSGDITGVVTNFYDVEDARPRFKKGEGGGEKFDVDALFPRELDEFRYVLATAGGPASSVPPRFRPVERTHDYVLYERTGITGRRRTLDEGVEPGAVLGCGTPSGRRIVREGGTAVVWRTPPVVVGPEEWQPAAEASDGAPATASLRLPEAGRWLLSLAYDSRRPLRVRAPQVGLDTTVAANLDFRGETPFFPVAEVSAKRSGRIAVTVEPQRPNLLARLLGAPNEAHLRSLSATPLWRGAIERIPLRDACGEYVDWYRGR